MMLYYPKRFIFLHVPKNAGTSMGMSLARSLCRGRYGVWSTKARLGELDPYKDLLKVRGYPSVNQAINYTNLLYETNFSRNDFFKFGVKRNPFDRAVSMYHWLLADRPPISKNSSKWLSRDMGITYVLKQKVSNFTEFVKLAFGSYSFFLFCFQDSLTVAQVLSPQASYIYDRDDNLELDYLVSYESLEEDWCKIMDDLGIKIELQWKNKSNRSREWESYYTPETKKIVRTFFKRDFELLGY